MFSIQLLGMMVALSSSGVSYWFDLKKLMDEKKDNDDPYKNFPYLITKTI
jgi:hypothetical protein